MLRILTACLAAAVLATGCVSIPRPLEGDFRSLQPDQADDRSVAARVRWGGTVIRTEPGSERTCIEVLARDLARNYRPVQSDQNHGRFLACKRGFQDPALFARGREITIAGRLEGFRDGTIGEYVYTYPVVDTDVVHLWPERSERVHPPYHDPWYRGPFWDPWPYYWHVGGSIIIRP